MKIDPQIINFFEQHNLNIIIDFNNPYVYQVKDLDDKLIFEFPFDIPFKDLLIGIETLLNACRENEHRGKDSLTWVSSFDEEDFVTVYFGSAFDIFVLTQALFKMGEYIRKENEYEEYSLPENFSEKEEILDSIGEICYDQHFKD